MTSPTGNEQELDATALEACPFCGCYLEKGRHYEQARVHPSTECSANDIVVWIDEPQSIAAWNRRASLGSASSGVVKAERGCIPYQEIEPGEHQEILDAIAAHNSGEE